MTILFETGSSSSIRILLISTTVISAAAMLKIFAPAAADFAVSDIPSIWNGVVSWLRPPYLYLVINCIIITIVASSKLQHHSNNLHDDVSPPPRFAPQIPPHHSTHLPDDVSHPPRFAAPIPLHHHVKEIQPLATSYNDVVLDGRYSNGVVLGERYSNGVVLDERYSNGVVVDERYSNGVVVDQRYSNGVVEDESYSNGGVVVDGRYNNGVVLNERYTDGVVDAVITPVTPSDFGVGNGADFAEEEAKKKVSGDEEFVISKSTWTRTMPERQMSPEYSVAAEKPPASARFSHRRNARPRSTPDGGKKALAVSRLKRQDTLETTWKTITEGRAMPLTRHLRKSGTWETHSRHHSRQASNDQKMMKKSETFNDRKTTTTATTTTATAKLKKEPSLGQDELNRRVEAFIRKFNEDMRLQRQESMNQYMEMVSRRAH